MTITPSHRDCIPAAKIPPAYHPLLSAIFDIVFLGVPTTAAANMVKADLADAKALIKCVEAIDWRFAPLLRNVLVSMIARQVARDLVDEIEADEDEK